MDKLLTSDILLQNANDTLSLTNGSNNLNLASQFENWLVSFGVSENIAEYLRLGIFILVIAILAYFSDIVTRRIIIVFIKKLVHRTKTTLDDVFLEKKVFNRLSHVMPALVIYYTIDIAIVNDNEVLVNIIKHAVSIYMILVGLLVIDAVFNALIIIYRRTPISKNIAIKGYVQVLKIILYIIGFVWVFSIIFNFQLGDFFTGLGAFVAVLILVFKDTILGFVASLQISGSNMVKIGDWISMPSHGADGTVEDISVYTVKVQNWDKTICTIPTYAMVSESFSNWRGMEESGGRRIKRSINIDMKSVRFCDKKMIEKFNKIQLLKDYITEALENTRKFNEENKVDDTILVNGRRLTNLGTFRKYIEAYLHQNSKIHDNMTFLVRQLQPTDKGIPIELYVFSNDQEWANYEAIQADIFDHLLAIVHEFDLSIFQNPTGDDFRMLRE